MPTDEMDTVGASRRFPVLDPEPPPLSWPARLRRVSASVAALLVIAAAAFLIDSAFASSGRKAPAASSSRGSPPGALLFLAPSGYLGTSLPDGSNLTILTRLGTFSEESDPVESADGALFMSSQGKPLQFDNGRVTAAKRVPLPSGFVPEPPAPFAGHDRFVVGAQSPSGSFSSSNPISAVSLGSGQVTSLGAADGYVGDPEQPGAFVAVPEAGAGSSTILQADARIELRDVGSAPVVIATAYGLERDLNLAAGPVSLEPVSDLQGDKIAVSVVPTDVGDAPTRGGIVLLDRSGNILGETPVEADQSVIPTPTWSPDGTRLAYAAASVSGPEIVVWNPDSAATGQSSAVVPGNPDGEGLCWWSPSGTWVMCESYSLSVGGPPGWDFWTPGQPNVDAVLGVGAPIAWLPEA